MADKVIARELAERFSRASWDAGYFEAIPDGEVV